MRGRIASLSFFLASAAVAVTWLTLLPVILRLLDALRRTAAPQSPEALLLDRLRGVLPFYLAADLMLIVLVCGVILYFALARPLSQTEATVEQLGKLRLDLPISASGGGPLLSRIQASLRRMASALAEEQAVTHRQLEQLRSANDELSRAQAELVAAERLATVGRLAAGVAHEIGNPLSGVLGYLTLLKMRSQDPQSSEFMDRIEAEVQRINGIVRGLLDLGRPPQMKLEPLELASLVSVSAQLVAAGPELRGVRLSNEVPSGLMARADPGPLSQVLINLFINAGQAMSGKGELRIRAQTGEGGSPGGVQLHVEDTGPGLPPDVQPRVFEPFFTTKLAGKGTGLGLAVSLHLIKSMGGDLRAENRPEGGARFTIELPSSPAMP